MGIRVLFHLALQAGYRNLETIGMIVLLVVILAMFALIARPEHEFFLEPADSTATTIAPTGEVDEGYVAGRREARLSNHVWLSLDEGGEA